jgi:MFS family permease
VRRRDLLKYIDFRRAMSAQFLGQTADSLTTITLAQVLIFNLSAGPSLTAMTSSLVVSLIPYLVVGPISGDFADRFHRRILLSRGQLLRAAFTLLAIVSTFTSLSGGRLVGFVCFCALLCLTRLLYTARATSLAALVRRHELVAADSSSLILGVIAGATGALISSQFSTQMPLVAFLISGTMHILAARQFAVIETELGGGARRTKTIRPSALLRQLWLPKTRFAMAATATHRALLGVCIASIAVMIDKSYNLNTTGYIAVLGFSAAGNFGGSVTAEWTSEKFPRRSITVIAFALTGFAIALACIFTNPFVALGAITVAAFSFQNLRVRSDATIQANASKANLGKIFASYDVLYNVAFIGGGIVGISATSFFKYQVVLAFVCGAYSVFAVIFTQLKDGKEKKFTHSFGDADYASQAREQWHPSAMLPIHSLSNSRSTKTQTDSNI